MNFVRCTVAGAWLVEPTPHADTRGRFMRAWCLREFLDHGIDFVPLQANMGYSHRKGTLRGLHYQQAPALEAKLVRCTRGSIFDVVVDLRPDSTTYLSWYGTCLSADNGHMVYVPEGCAHGCQSVEDSSEFHYMSSAMFSASHARGAKHDDPAFGIAWPLPVSEMSIQDRNWPLHHQGEGKTR